MLLNNPANHTVCIVAIIKNEDRFLEEWIAYHLIIGVTHFFLYDNGSDIPLSTTLAKYASFVTVVPWTDSTHETLEGRNRQTKAYEHAVNTFALNYEWAAFIDCDEFIVLTGNSSIQHFLSAFHGVGCVSLNWYFFGHNGYYETPDGLVTALFTRRRLEPGTRSKSICRSKAITHFNSAHFGFTTPEWPRVDANNFLWDDPLYEGKTQRAHINHYYCRSFLAWRDRTSRGDVAFDTLNGLPADQLWRFDDRENLKKFVATVAVTDNEYVDEHMLKFTALIKTYVEAMRTGVPLPSNQMKLIQ